MDKKVPGKLPIKYYSSVKAKNIEWLWYPYIPYGKITIIQGDPGDGKTTLVLNIAAFLSNGQAIPNTDIKLERNKIIYQSAEDGIEDTIKPRLISAGADCSQIAFIDESEYGLTLNDARIENAIMDINARLMVIDPLQAYLGENNDMSRADGIRPIMKRLTAVAERTKCAIVIIGHMNKANGSKGIYRGLGSIDITASARSVLLVGRIKNNPSIRVMAQLKNSLASEGKPVAFEINDDSAIRWIGEYDISVEELLSGEAVIHETKTTNAIEIITDILNKSETPCTEIYGIMLKNGISKRSVDRVKKQLGIKSIKRADCWYWSLQTDNL